MSPPPVGTLGASSVAAVLGLSPWASPWSVWAELRGVIPHQNEQTGPMWLGTVLEDHIRERWAREMEIPMRPGWKYGEPPLTPPNDAPSWRHARPDGVAEVDATTDDLGEIKAVLFAEAPEWGADASDAIPLYYQPQVVQQADVYEAATGRRVRGTHVIACDRARGDLRTYWIPHDRQRAAALRTRLWSWYERHILGGEQPDPDKSEACRLAAAALYSKPSKEWIPPTEEHAAMVADLVEMRQHRDAVDASIAVVENRLRLHIASAAGIAGLVSWTHRTRAGKPSAGQLKIWSTHAPE